MKVTFPKPEDGFRLLPCVIAGTDCVLITPSDIKTKFTEQNKIFRSSIWTIDGTPVSLGYRKFVNYGEAPAFEPMDINEKGIKFPRKIDGSCLIVSSFKGELIVRTRGTVDARRMENGAEIEYLMQKYPKAFSNVWLDSGFSCIYEWTTPSNVIVLAESKEPELWLTGIINHANYSYAAQNILDDVAAEMGVNRPETFAFDSFPEMVKAVEAFRGKEGVVAYSADGQTLKKIKSVSYLAMHRMKDRLGSDENVVDYFLANDCTSAETLMASVTKDSDYEVAKVVELVAPKIAELYQEAVTWLDEAMVFVDTNIRNLANRKDQAQAILAFNKGRAGFMFMMLDGKIKAPFPKETIKKIMMEKF